VGYEGSLRSQLRRADKLGSHYVFILGDDELSSGRMQWKNLRDGSQGEVEITQVEEFVSSRLIR
jgi:histidyl-tRNA synthetase